MFKNQRTVRIGNSRIDMKSGRQFVAVYVSDIEKAAKELNGTAFKVYMYFCGMSEGFECEYSPKHIQKAYGVSEDSARDAIKELRTHGFLTKESDNVYVFHRNIHEELSVYTERRLFRGESGNVKPLTKKQLYNYLKKKTSKEDIARIWEAAEIAS